MRNRFSRSTLLYSCIALIFALLSGPACFAEPAKTNIKLVFPFGGTAIPKIPSGPICPTQYSTSDGCCSDNPGLIYTYSGKRGCCSLPRSLTTAEGVTGCCSDHCPTGTIYGKTSAAVCGHCCSTAAGMEIVSYSGNQSCCSACTSRIGQWTENVCGQCCGTGEVGSFSWPYQIAPDGGIIFSQSYAQCCMPGTKAASLPPALSGTTCCQTGVSAYAYPTMTAYYYPNGQISQNMQFMSGCCPFGTSLNSLNASAAVCCSAGYSGYSSVFYFAYHPNGSFAGNYTIGGMVYCCPTGSSVRPFSDTSMGTGCCQTGQDVYAFVDTLNYYSNSTLGLRRYSPGCCPTGTTSKILADNMGTYCCSAGENAFYYKTNSASYSYDWSYTPTYINTYSVKCCPTGQSLYTVSVASRYPYSYQNDPQVDRFTLSGICCSTNNLYSYKIRVQFTSSSSPMHEDLMAGCCSNGQIHSLNDGLGTICCSTGQSPYAVVAQNNFHSNGSLDFAGYSAGCCTGSTHSILSGGVSCCPAGSPFYDYLAQVNYHSNGSVSRSFNSTSCCTTGQSAASLPYGLGTYCCSTGSSPYVLKSVSYYDETTPAFLIYRTGCCLTGQSALSIPNDNGTVCCSPTSSLAYYEERTLFNSLGVGVRSNYVAGCCAPANLKSLPNNIGTVCCIPTSSAYAYESSVSYYSTGSKAAVSRAAGCCAMGYEAKSLPGDWGTYCCLTAQSVYGHEKTKVLFSDGQVSGTMRSVGCCTTTQEAKSLPGSLGTYCCATNQSAYAYPGYVWSSSVSYYVGCCGTTQAAQTLPDDLGTYCCPTGQSAYASLLTSSSYTFGCCYNGTVPKSLGFSRGNYCCSSDVDAFNFLVHAQNSYTGTSAALNFSTGCCQTGETSHSLSFGIGTSCCSPGLSHYTYRTDIQGYYSDGSPRGPMYSTSCCSAADDKITTLPFGMGTMGCPKNVDAVYYASIWESYHPNGNLEYHMGTNPTCCTYMAGKVATSLPDNRGTWCCSSGEPTFLYKQRVDFYINGQLRNVSHTPGCCPSGRVIKSVPGGLGTYCCPPNKSVSVSIASYSDITTKWSVYVPSCQ